MPRPSGLPQKDLAWMTSPQVSKAEKDAFIEHFAGALSGKFVQHCELLNPLHVCIQIGIRSFVLALKRAVHQPVVANIKVSEMPKGQREDFLKNSIESLEYYILAQTTIRLHIFGGTATITFSGQLVSVQLTRSSCLPCC
jgi:hypothetical protein